MSEEVYVLKRYYGPFANAPISALCGDMESLREEGMKCITEIMEESEIPLSVFSQTSDNGFILQNGEEVLTYEGKLFSEVSQTLKNKAFSYLKIEYYQWLNSGAEGIFQPIIVLGMFSWYACKNVYFGIKVDQKKIIRKN